MSLAKTAGFSILIVAFVAGCLLIGLIFGTFIGKRTALDASLCGPNDTRDTYHHDDD